MKGITQQQKAIADDWARGKINLTVVARRFKRTKLGSYILLARTLRELYLEAYEKK